MPSLIKKRGRKRWRGFVQVNHIIRQKLFPDDSKKSHKEAIIWEKETKHELMTSLTETGIPSACWTAIDWANEYLTDARERFSKKTFDEKRYAFSNLFKSIKPEMPINDLNPAVAIKHLRKQANNRSGNASNKDRKNLGVAWNWGRKYLNGFPQELNPFLSVDKFHEQRSPRYIPPEEDFWAVYKTAEGQDRVMLFTFLNLAARRNEVFGLTWEDIDFLNNRVRLWTSKRKGGHREFDWLPMTSDLREVLMQWRKDRPIKNVSHVFVFLDQLACTEKYYGQPFRVRQHFMRRICKKANVKPFGFHAIRHLTASILYNKGNPVSLIQAVLRHKNPNTTTRYLRSLGLEHVREGLEEALKSPVKIVNPKTEDEID